MKLVLAAGVVVVAQGYLVAMAAFYQQLYLELAHVDGVNLERVRILLMLVNY